MGANSPMVPVFRLQEVLHMWLLNMEFPTAITNVLVLGSHIQNTKCDLH
jgi:nucleosome binding factor SPN SPT16 subunit